ncbi:unnamed protein product [Ambrosiozyma monospora]|uniref:Unnamed protein product n=1 Tax=Ambrosiozyma monospora TaxID=43982 RepID=A0ACB5T013_AMBMO|nr:unnamed protein product [Ambrosiozyma monospora]
MSFTRLFVSVARNTQCSAFLSSINEINKAFFKSNGQRFYFTKWNLLYLIKKETQKDEALASISSHLAVAPHLDHKNIMSTLSEDRRLKVIKDSYYIASCLTSMSSYLVANPHIDHKNIMSTPSEYRKTWLSPNAKRKSPKEKSNHFEDHVSVTGHHNMMV